MLKQTMDALGRLRGRMDHIRKNFAGLVLESLERKRGSPDCFAIDKEFRAERILVHIASPPNNSFGNLTNGKTS